MLRILLLILAPILALAGCTAPSPANPALWRIDGPHGERGWLFGTIHALDSPADWQTPKVAQALAASDRLVVEVANVGDSAAMAHDFQALAHTPGEPPLSARVPPALRAKLAETLKTAHMRDGDFSDVETWAAALALARALAGDEASANGVDSAVVKQADTRPVVELEGAAAQFALFDRLSETEQRALLAFVVEDGGKDDGEADLADAWRRGDMARIERATRTGMLADPGLREALYTRRNRAWADKLAALLHTGARPFVAVGAAHMAGSAGLPVLLAQAGFRVTRVE